MCRNNAIFFQGQTNISLHNVHNYPFKDTLQQQYNAKSVKENEHPTSLVSKHTKRRSYKECKKCKLLRNKNTTENDYNVVLKCLNNSEKMDPDCLNELKNFFNCKTSAYITSIIHRITQDPKTKKLNNDSLDNLIDKTENKISRKYRSKASPN
ncbi:24281_t:CDS:2 [Gigaspora rosea]|nr:24281_t:CDS:2 [Gigaspora rosea]